MGVLRNAGGFNGFTVLQLPGQHALLTTCGEVKALGRPYWGLAWLKGAIEGEKLFSRACSDRTEGNGLKMKESKFKLETKKKFFTVMVVNTGTREVVDAPTLETFKVSLDRALGNLV